MDLQALFEYQLAGVSVVRWALIFVIVLGAVAILGAIKRFIQSRIVSLSEQHEQLQWLNYLEAMFGKPKIFLYLAVGLYAGLRVFEVAEPYGSTGRDVVQVLVLVQLGIWADAALAVLIDRLKSEIEDDPAQVTALSAINFIVDAVIWSLVVLLALDNLGFDITALIASLGIGGVAVALAAQKILGDLFAFFSIIVDKPFLKGDFVVVGDFAGSIEHIGIKTTRLRSIDGEQIVFSNEDLLQSRLRNYKRMENRRSIIEFGVTYDTSDEAIDAIPGMVEEIVRDQQQVEFGRAHLKDFGDSSLRYEVVYSVLDPDYNVHMDVRQQILSSILKTLRSRDIDFAFPTRTVHVSEETEVQQAA